MGLIRIRDRDIRLAESQRFRDDALDRPWFKNASGLLIRWRTEARLLGVRLVSKRSLFGLRFSKFSTAYYKEIRLGTTYNRKSDEWKAVTLGHELVHSRQWRGYGRNTFRTRYILSMRWRWAIEVQAYAESVRILAALGASREEISNYIDTRPGALWDSYGLRGLRKKDVYTYTLRTLRDARDEALRRLE